MGGALAHMPIEIVLTDALKPCKLSDANRHIQTIESLQKTVSSDELVESLGKYYQPLTEIKQFFKVLARLSSQEDRSKWYSETYPVTPTPHQPQRHHKKPPAR